MKKISLFSFDLILFSVTLFLMITGILFIYSSGFNINGKIISAEYEKQIIWVISGLILLIFFSLLDYSILKRYSIHIYVGTILILIITLIFGKEVNGAKSWLGFGDFGIQPSEFAKIATILLFGNYLFSVGKRITELKYFLLGLILVLIPMGLILKQPDMGTALVFIPIFLMMSYIAGANSRHILFVILIGIFTLILGMLPKYQLYILGQENFLITILTDWEYVKFILLSLFIIFALSVWGNYFIKEKYFYWIGYFSIIGLISFLSSFLVRKFLSGYQIERLIIFLDPFKDERGFGMQTIQSMNAIGSGGFWGKGLFKGTQSQLNYIPQQSTDFIFSILAEEWGFIGGLFIIILFLLIILRGVKIISITKDNYAVNIGTGIVSMIFFHVFVNIGMTIGIMPITGIPVFFLSYGGSSLWTAAIGIGILLDIYQRRYRY